MNYPDNYYSFYENRYRTVYDAGIETWSGQALTHELDAFIQFNDSITEGSRIIDLGCGEGRNAAYMSQRGCTVTGVDLSITALKKAKQLFGYRENLFFLNENVLTLDSMRNHIFDAAISIGCLHMLVQRHHRRLFLEQVRRVVKPEGLIFMINQGDGQHEKKTSPDDTLKVERRRVAGDQDVFINLPRLPSWQRLWSDHLYELQEQKIKILHTFSNINSEYGECMCVIGMT